MQNPHSRLHAGDLVRLRGTLWRIIEVSAFESCDALRLQPLESTGQTAERTFLYPFDRPIPLEGRREVRTVRRRRWIRAARDLVIGSAPLEGLRCAASARLVVLPHQIEPSLAIVRGLGTRLLIADDVGLGKTVQAGLILAELRTRGEADRVLVLTPAGLRDQWDIELGARFGIRAIAADAAWLRRAGAELPVGINPWSIPGTYLVSIDFAKQPEVLQGLTEIVWDLLMIDEAHGVASSSHRSAAARRLGAAARRLVLLTATPHAGDDEAFARLCRIGEVDGDAEPLLMFRRGRRDVGMPVNRRTRLLRVRLSPDEQRMHALLDAYIRHVWVEAAATANDARLAMTVLKKRALSSAASLASSVARRLSALASDVAPAQSRLPFADAESETGDDDRELGAVLAAAGLTDARRERAWLGAIEAAARRAARQERKLMVLARLLCRTNEPVIVFTEYRDTLTRIAEWLQRSVSVTTLHGGLSLSARP